MTNNNTQSYILQRIVNAASSAEGSILPPVQAGGTRVPVVQGLRLLRSTGSVGGTLFSIAWLDPVGTTAQIDHYNIFIKGLPGIPKTQYYGPAVATNSPGSIFVPATAGTPVSIVVQTVLRNGMQSDIQLSPSVAGSVTAAPDPAMSYRIAVPDAAYVASPTDSLIAFPALTAARTVTLPAPQQLPNGKSFVIKDESGAAGTHNILIDCAATVTLDGAALPVAVITTNYGSSRLYSDGTNFFTW